MKSRIFMYLFIFSALLLIFQYANSKNILDKYEVDIQKFKAKLKVQEQQISALEDENFELNYFNIEQNDNALDYFISQGYDVNKIINDIKEGLYNMNDYEGDDHPIVPFVSMTESKLLINKIRILNHKWIIANFTDGKHWGEIFLTYEIGDDNSLKYNLVEYFMYPTY